MYLNIKNNGHINIQFNYLRFNLNINYHNQNYYVVSCSLFVL